MPWIARLATPADRAALAKLSCSIVGDPWTDEAQAFVRHQLVDWAFDARAKGAQPRIVIVQARRGGAIVGVAAHEHVRLGLGENRVVEATQLVVVALARRWQGKAFATGDRASDVLVSAAIADIQGIRPRRSERVFAKVHRENLRSIGLCARYGLTHRLKIADRDYVGLVNESLTS